VEIWYQYLNLVFIVVLAEGLAWGSFSSSLKVKDIKVAGGDTRPTVLIIKNMTIIEEEPHETNIPGLDERHR
jgi:hypothetical protein